MDVNTQANGAAFLREVVDVFPCRIHTVLTDNRSSAGDRSASWKDRLQKTAEAAWPLPIRPVNRGRYPEIEALVGGHIFDRVCDQHGVTHKLTKPITPSAGSCLRSLQETDRWPAGQRWTNGQAQRMNRTVEDATIKAFHYPDLTALQAHVLTFVTAYNFAQHKAPRWRTPFQAICDVWTAEPSIFKINPHHLVPGPHS